MDKNILKLIFLVFVAAVACEVDADELALKEKQVMETTKSLKSVIEENQSLISKTQQLETELKKLRDEKISGASSYSDLRKERDMLSDKIKKVRKTNRKYSKEIKNLEKNLKRMEVANVNQQPLVKKDTVKSQELASISTVGANIQKNTQQNAPMVIASVSDEDVVDREAKTLDLLTRIDAFTEEDDDLRLDAAKAHYNMGNIYFNKGEYEIAAREYYQAVTLLPDDPDAHYNLAFVSGKYLGDFRTSMKHYKIYLYLNPQADDSSYVKEQILHASLMIKGEVKSELEDRY